MCPKCGNLITAGDQAPPPAQTPKDSVQPPDAGYGALPPQGATPPPQQEVEMKFCPFCSEHIPAASTECPKCNESFVGGGGGPSELEPEDEAAERREMMRLQMEADEQGKTAFWVSIIGWVCFTPLVIVGFILALMAFAKGNKSGSVSGYTIGALVISGLCMLAIISLIVMVAVGSVTFFGQAQSIAEDAACESNMRAMGAAISRYEVNYGGYPDWTGKDLWLRMADEGELNWSQLVSPASGKSPGPGVCTYRGPMLPLYDLSPDAPIACDEPDTHSDGRIHVLYLNGEVRTYQKGSQRYHDILDMTQ
jgi:hypothetical protein